MLSLVSFGIALAFWFAIGHWLLELLHVSQESTIGHGIVVVVHHAVATAAVWVILKLSIPFLVIAQRAIAVHEMGLRWATVKKGDIHNLLPHYLQHHPVSEDVRIICISGNSLFGTEKTHTDCALRKWASRGRLDVVMPVSSPDNPTVAQRWLTYSEDVRLKEYPNQAKLIEEMDAGKTYLRQRRNTVTEHRILCMWRVVILQRFCLVQNYFPNTEGLPSDTSPTFVYENTGPMSYYQTYLEMFRLIKGQSGRNETMGVP